MLDPLAIIEFIAVKFYINTSINNKVRTFKAIFGSSTFMGALIKYGPLKIKCSQMINVTRKYTWVKLNLNTNIVRRFMGTTTPFREPYEIVETIFNRLFCYGIHFIKLSLKWRPVLYAQCLHGLTYRRTDG